MKLLLSSGLALLPIATPAAAAVILTPENADYLCVAAGGEEVVDTDKLAHLIASEAKADRFLDGANSTGQRDGVIQLRSSATAPSEAVYAVTYPGGNLESSARPFGPNLDLAANEAASKARAAMTVLLGELQFLTDNGFVRASDNLTYRLRERRTVGSRRERADAQHPVHLFSANPAYQILCEHTAVTAEQTPGGAKKPPAGAVTARLVLRGAVKDLAIAPGDLKDATPASIRFDRDGVADTDTLKINGIVGLRVGHKSGAFQLIPYLSYENKSITGAGNDVEKLSPGVLFAHRYETPSLAVHSKLEASYIEDLQQDSQQGKLRLYVEPAFALGQGRGVLFGSYLRPIGPLWLRPDLTLIADVSKVFDAGTSGELANADDYYGFGGELSIRARLELARPISDLSIKAGIRQLFMMGEINQEQVRRLYGSIEYAPKDFPYIGVSLQFSRGENDDTFQDEKTYGVGLTLRY